MKHILTVDRPFTSFPTKSTTDGAFCGNGDIAVIWGGTCMKPTMYISKADFWRAEENNPTEGGPGPVARVCLQTPTLADAKWHMEQDMDMGQVRCFYENAYSTLEIRTDVLMQTDLIYTELRIKGARLSHSVELQAPEGAGVDTASGEKQGIYYADREYKGEKLLYSSKVRTAMKRLPVREEGQWRVYPYLFAVMTNHDRQDYQLACIRSLWALNEEELFRARSVHAQSWRDFWAKSRVTIPQRNLEMMWYAGQYVLRICGGNSSFPPGIYGNLITSDNMQWHGDYHLNYNYEAAFYGLVSSNHTELTDGYARPLLDFLPEGKRFAEELLGCRGIYYPVGIGPLGYNSSAMSTSNEHGQLFLGQKTNASYAATILCMRWYGTYDTEYAKTVAYPYLKQCGEFWEDYLTEENSRYIDQNDAAHEVWYYTGENFVPDRHKDRNPCIGLGLIRMVFTCLLDMAKTLNENKNTWQKWQDILDRLSDFPICERGGKPVFRLTEEGQEKAPSNGLDIQHIYPCGCIGSDSEERYIQAAKNSLFSPERWEDNNACSSVYPAAVRMGIDSDYLIEKLSGCLAKHVQQNGLFIFGGGCIENSSVVPVTVNEMLLQSYEGVIRLFPNWNRKNGASYENLRADGAFLVSAELREERITAKILSEKGRDLTVENPYKDRAVTLRTGRTERTLPPDGRLTLHTRPGQSVTLF